MDAHVRFLAHRPDERWQASSPVPPPLSELVDKFYNCIAKLNEDHCSRSNLEILRNVLCTFYQAKLMSNAVIETGLQFDSLSFKNLDIGRARNDLYLHELDAEDLSLVLDILSLRMALCSTSSEIMDHMNELLKFMHQQLEEDDEIKILDIKLMDRYMDSYFLNRKISSVSSLDGQEVKRLFLRNVHLWMIVSSHQDCQILTVLLPKLLEVADNGMHPYNLTSEIISHIWSRILLMDLDEILSMLRVTYKTWFPTDILSVSKLSLEDALKEPLWILLLKGLSSQQPQQRQDALFLIKKVVNFIDELKGENFKLGNYEKVRPLLLNAGDDGEQNTFKRGAKDYFMIIKGSEPKEPQFVLPMLPLLQIHAKETLDEKNHGASFHIAWIRCAFSRFLKHDNDSVVKQGLLNVFELDPELCDAEFLHTVVESLSNSALYKNDPNKGEPIVLKALITFLNNAETKNTDLLTRFVVKASKIEWNHCALFYVIRALSRVTKVGTSWKKPELEAVRSLAVILPTMECPVLRIGSQIQLLDTMTNFTTEPLDLLTVAKTLSAFPASEALTRGQSAWNRTTTWLSKLVKEEEAIKFLENICGKIAFEHSSTDLNMKSLSLIIMLFHDAHLLLNSKSCRGFAALHNLLNCLNNAKSGPHDNSELVNGALELVNSLLDLSSSKDGILHEFISNYAEAILRLSFRILRHIPEKTVIENINTYISLTQQLFSADSSIIAKQKVINHIERFELESCNIIDDEEWSNDVQRLFGVKILHACLMTKSKDTRNYNFIGRLCEAYKNPMARSCVDAEATDQTGHNDVIKIDTVSSEYYKIVAELFYEYVKDQPANEWIPDINWINEISHLNQIGESDICVPFSGILSQVFHAEALTMSAEDIEDFVVATRICWKSMLPERKYRTAMKKIIDLIFSSPFLKRGKTRELAIECALHMAKEASALRVILLNGLKQVKGKYVCYFYDALLTCLLEKTLVNPYEAIEQQACSDILDSYEDLYPDNLSCIQLNNAATATALAVTLLHQWITADSTHAKQLLPLICKKDAESLAAKDLPDIYLHHSQSRIMQVFLILEPQLILPKDIEPLHTLLCDRLLSQSFSCLSARLLQELLLIRIYENHCTLRSKIWELLDQGQELKVDSLRSVFSIVYHVSRLIYSMQSEFINSALQHIIPYHMSDESDVRLHAQVITSMLYDIAVDEDFSTLTVNYKDLYTALTKSKKQKDSVKNPGKIEGLSIFETFDPTNHYSLETLFYEIPKLSNADEYIQPHIFEKVGFEKKICHPLTLLNSRHVPSESDVSYPSWDSAERLPVLNECGNVLTNDKSLDVSSSSLDSGENAEQVLDDSHSSRDLFCDEDGISMEKSIRASEDEYFSGASASP